MLVVSSMVVLPGPDCLQCVGRLRPGAADATRCSRCSRCSDKNCSGLLAKQPGTKTAKERLSTFREVFGKCCSVL